MAMSLAMLTYLARLIDFALLFQFFLPKLIQLPRPNGVDCSPNVVAEIGLPVPNTEDEELPLQGNFTNHNDGMFSKTELLQSPSPSKPVVFKKTDEGMSYRWFHA